jgi:hypothetical protein
MLPHDHRPGSPALTEPLGWNSWNSFGCGVDETQVRQATDAMVSSGMKDAGYQYVVVEEREAPRLRPKDLRHCQRSSSDGGGRPA